MTTSVRRRAGILGGGMMAEVHAQAIRQAGGRVAGVRASTDDSTQRAARLLDAERGFDSVAALLDSVDVVHVCTPNGLHTPQVLAAAARGVHVICEKPLSTNVVDADRMVEATGSLTATVPFVYRFHPLVREARARVRTGQTGRILTVSGAYLQDWLVSTNVDNWRLDEAAGGRSRAFADIGSHLMDLVEFVTDDRITRIAAAKRTYWDTRGGRESIATEDAVVVALELSSGAIGTLLVSQVAPGRKNALTIELGGSAESLAFEQENPEVLWVGRLAGSMSVPRDPDQLAPDAARLCALPAGHPQGYQDAFNAFVADSYAAMDGGDPEGLPRFTDGRRSVLLVEAVMNAAESGAWTTIEG